MCPKGRFSKIRSHIPNKNIIASKVCTNSLTTYLYYNLQPYNLLQITENAIIYNYIVHDYFRCLLQEVSLAIGGVMNIMCMDYIVSSKY